MGCRGLGFVCYAYRSPGYEGRDVEAAVDIFFSILPILSYIYICCYNKVISIFFSIIPIYSPI